jgi:hypothetical protein
MVEANSNYIIDIEILDKRHVGLASTKMEREAVKRGLERLTQDIKVVEFTNLVQYSRLLTIREHR